MTLTYTNQLAPQNVQNQEVLNTTATILTLMQNVNENINAIIDKLNQYYRAFPETFDSEDKTNPIDFSKKILNIFNMTEDDLYKNISKDAGATNLKIGDDEKLQKNEDEGFEQDSASPKDEDFLKEEEFD